MILAELTNLASAQLGSSIVFASDGKSINS